MNKYVRIAGSLALLGLLVWKVDFADVGHALSHVGWGWCATAIALYFAAQFVSGLRWQALGRPVAFHESFGRYSSYYFIGNFFNMVLPTSVGGDVVRAWYLDAGSGRRWLAFLTVLADRLNGLFVLVALACVAAIIMPLPPWVVAWTAVAGTCAVFGLCLLIWMGRMTPASHHTTESGKRWGVKIRRKLAELAEVSRIYGRSPRLLAGVTSLSLLVQVANVVLVWLLAVALGVDVSLGYCFVFVPLVTLLTLAPVSVNGMGIREGGTVLLLQPLGVPAEQAVTLSLLWFSVFTVAGLAGALCYLLGRFPRYEVSSDAVPVGGYSDQGRARQPQAAA